MLLWFCLVLGFLGFALLFGVGLIVGGWFAMAGLGCCGFLCFRLIVLLLLVGLC